MTIRELITELGDIAEGNMEKQVFLEVYDDSGDLVATKKISIRSYREGEAAIIYQG